MSRLKSFLVFIRSGQISGKIKGLSDYEEVKAVHDYIILHNEYNRSSGGACILCTEEIRHVTDMHWHFISL